MRTQAKAAKWIYDRGLFEGTNTNVGRRTMWLETLACSAGGEDWL